MEKLLYSNKECANLLGVTPAQLKLSRHSGELFKGVLPPRHLRFKKAIRYHQRDIEDWLEGRPSYLTTAESRAIRNRLKKSGFDQETNTDRYLPREISPLSNTVITILADCLAKKHLGLFTTSQMKVLNNERLVPISIVKRIARNSSIYCRRVQNLWDGVEISKGSDKVIKAMVDMGFIKVVNIDNRRYIKLRKGGS